MKEILIKNKEILNRLDGFIKAFYEAGIEAMPIVHKDRGVDKHHAVSNEYLEKMLKENKGPPDSIKCCDLVAWDRDPKKPMPRIWKDISNDVSNNFTRELGAQQNALCAYYPEDGFIGWHDNQDVPGYTVLFNWSENGDSFYRFRHPETHKIITINDKPGWSCKTGYYGDGTLSTFHCASTNEPRWSIAFYLRSKELRDQLVEDIQYE